MSGRIVGAVVLVAGRHVSLIEELHSTKGWRPPFTVNNQRFGNAPVQGSFHRVKSEALPAENSGRLERNRKPWENTPVDLMRHGWYRRKMMAPEPAVTSQASEGAT